jgi:hypothetical protein
MVAIAVNSAGDSLPDGLRGDVMKLVGRGGGIAEKL